jgi:hypothetical protein
MVQIHWIKPRNTSIRTGACPVKLVLGVPKYRHKVRVKLGVLHSILFSNMNHKYVCTQPARIYWALSITKQVYWLTLAGFSLRKPTEKVFIYRKSSIIRSKWRGKVGSEKLISWLFGIRSLDYSLAHRCEFMYPNNRIWDNVLVQKQTTCTIVLI